MDDWAKKYLRTWQSDFADEPDAELCFRFLEDILSDLQRLPQEGPTNADATYDKVSNPIIAAITSLPDPELGLEYVQTFSSMRLYPPRLKLVPWQMSRDS